jgi:SAM-dependent methyltransferase
MSRPTYAGTDLDLFAAATRWKSYLRRQVGRDLRGDVLEVGAGIGGTTQWLCSDDLPRWTCLEPDPVLASRLSRAIEDGSLPECCEVVAGTIDDLPGAPDFDTILYIDVLEHIEDDAAELDRAARRLRPGGRVVVLSPAHHWLYSPFDRAIGHFRRYTKRTLAALTPAALRLDRLVYLDAAGLLASLGNCLVLGWSMPTARQVAFWDRVLVPCSRRLDPLLGHAVGKSVLGVWRKP